MSEENAAALTIIRFDDDARQQEATTDFLPIPAIIGRWWGVEERRTVLGSIISLLGRRITYDVVTCLHDHSPTPPVEQF